ncbi:Gfo/Idh/MocA family oxidoreductase [Candidatus Pelagibacter communis]|uniref:Gfo/Idh/MocA family oxidoreductase n=1 Tax=Pelagibacter ubique TaxID=198252 RepID=UPI00094CB48C|nr:Gfo/Idh/MocA family oxidoreductase [Candidatus Pelagibacter ubique]|tara:strand:+ start:2331 stop:3053 length:723 start_codon:yes stop_codon:yes gene_type:complete
MKEVCLIGFGKWGRKVFSSLNKINIISKIHLKKSRFDKNDIDYSNLDWVIITTNVDQHYGLVKKYLKKKINVFCEKPLTNSVEKDKELILLSKKMRTKLYISDIENYKIKNLEIIKENFISRSKFSSNKKNILSRLVYHDFTYIYDKILNKRLQKIKILINKKGQLSFVAIIDNKKFFFNYNLNQKKNVHSFNKKNLKTKKNVLKDMLTDVISEKANFKKNIKISIFANTMINKINDYLN